MLSASEPDNFFSGHRAVSNEAQCTAVFAPKTTTMRRTNRHLFRPIWRLSARILRAKIVEWWFPMHLDKTVARLQWTVPLLELGLNLTTRELEKDSASLRCTATSTVLDHRHRQFEARARAAP
jgi:hypothetical protein